MSDDDETNIFPLAIYLEATLAVVSAPLPPITTVAINASGTKAAPLAWNELVIPHLFVLLPSKAKASPKS